LVVLLEARLVEGISKNFEGTSQASKGAEKLVAFQAESSAPLAGKPCSLTMMTTAAQASATPKDNTDFFSPAEDWLKRRMT
jgi:hypothetical protein